MSLVQLSLPLPQPTSPHTYQDRLVELLSQDLDFHGQDSSYASHNFHSFPAKFPPQLPRKFIEYLTAPGDVVLDPMSGSGTTLLEAHLAGRTAIGVDIDPLAVLIAGTKTSPLNALQVAQTGNTILSEAKNMVSDHFDDLSQAFRTHWDQETRAFIDNWFTPDIQIELFALLTQIETLPDPALRNFFKLTLSAIIITKTGGVSLALDLAHTRPHRAKLIYSKAGEVLEGAEYLDNPRPNLRYATKTLRSAFAEFEKRFHNNLRSIQPANLANRNAQILFGNAQALPLLDNSVDLIVTSPPYASNAIDYMRAHKFSLVWLGYSLNQLGGKRNEYIGGEGIKQFEFENLPQGTAQLVAEISRLDAKKGQVLHRYYSEMTRCLQEIYRVIKPGKAAILVVGSSIMRNRDTDTQNCLADIGKAIGFDVPKIGVRCLDRNRRMLPTGQTIDRESQIQQRMHEEYVIGFYKPET